MTDLPVPESVDELMLGLGAILHLALEPRHVMSDAPASATPAICVAGWAAYYELVWTGFVAKQLSKDEYLDLVQKHYDHVLLSPTERVENPTREQVFESVVTKLSRNLRLGMIDCFLVISAMYRYITEVRKISPTKEHTIMSILLASQGFIVWLSSIHDDQQVPLLYNRLLGLSDDMAYHELTITEVIGGEEYRIPLDKLKWVGSEVSGHIGVVDLPERRKTFDTTTMGCPVWKNGSMPYFWERCCMAFIVAQRWPKK
jgi:hypothetical protein